jgi:hypothetical protein
LRSSAAVAAGMRLDIEFADGRVGATADERDLPPVKGKTRGRGGGEGPGGQGNLFGS